MTAPTVSVVIPTLDAAGRIPQLLDMLLRQTVKPVQILVVDSSSQDGTPDVARAYEGVEVRVIDRSTFNHGLTRHEALLQTTGDFVCFMTDDAVPADECLVQNLVKPMLEDGRVAMVSGRQLPKPDARPFERLVREFNYGPVSNSRGEEDIPTYGIKTFFASDACACYRRSAYLACGGFERVNTNEDMLMARRFVAAGYRVAYAADARVLHSHNLSPSEQYRRNKAVGYFLQTHEEDFAGLGEIGEGSRLAMFVLKNLLAGGHPLEAVAFCVDCAARLAGNRAGRAAARKTVATGAEGR